MISDLAPAIALFIVGWVLLSNWDRLGGPPRDDP